MFVVDRNAPENSSEKISFIAVNNLCSETSLNKPGLDLSTIELRRRSASQLEVVRHVKSCPAKEKQFLKISALVALCALHAMFLSGCGSSAEPPRPKEYSLAGSVHFGTPVEGAEVRAYSYDGLSKGKLLASSKTDEKGAFQITHKVPHQGFVLITAQSGHWQDTATGLKMELPNNELLKAVVPDSNNAKAIGVTGVSTLAAAYIETIAKEKGALTAEDINEAFLQFSQHFYGSESADWILETKPLEMQENPLGPAERDVRNQLIHAGLSYLAKEISLQNHYQAGTLRIFDLLEALVKDLADKNFDGTRSGAIVFIDRAEKIPLDPQLTRNHLASNIDAYLQQQEKSEGKKLAVDRKGLFAPGGFLANLMVGEKSRLFKSAGQPILQPGIYAHEEQRLYMQQATDETTTHLAVGKTGNIERKKGLESVLNRLKNAPKNLLEYLERHKQRATSFAKVDWKSVPTFSRWVTLLDSPVDAPTYRVRAVELYGVKELHFAHGLICPEPEEARGRVELKDDVAEVTITAKTSTVPLDSIESASGEHCLRVWALSADGKVLATDELKFRLQPVSPPIYFEFDPDDVPPPDSGAGIGSALLYNFHSFPVKVKATMSGNVNYRLDSIEELSFNQKIENAYGFASPFHIENLFMETQRWNQGGEQFYCMQSQPRYTRICRPGEIIVFNSREKVANRACEKAHVDCESPDSKYSFSRWHFNATPVIDSHTETFAAYKTDFKVYYRAFWRNNAAIGDVVNADENGFITLPPFGAVLATWLDENQPWLMKGKKGEKTLLIAEDHTQRLCQEARCKIRKATWKPITLAAQLIGSEDHPSLSFETALQGAPSKYRGMIGGDVSWTSQEFK